MNQYKHVYILQTKRLVQPITHHFSISDIIMESTKVSSCQAGASIVARKSSKDYLYYSCKICGESSHLLKVIDHINKKHKNVVSSVQFYAPSFKRIVKDHESKDNPDLSSSKYQCIYCDTYFTYILDIINHVKHAHDFVVKSKVMGTPSTRIVALEASNPAVEECESNSFSLPANKTIDNQALQNENSVPDSIISVGLRSSSESLVSITAADKNQVNPVVSRKKGKKYAPQKVNYFKELKNFIVSDPQRKKLAVWSTLFLFYKHKVYKNT